MQVEALKHELDSGRNGLAFLGQLLDRRTKSFEMFLQDADGRDVIQPISVTADIPAPAEGMTYRTHRMVHGMYGLNFQKFGDYQVSWVLDGTEVHAVHFRVIQRDVG